MAQGPLDIPRVRQGLASRRLGRKIHYFPLIDSTNSCARRLAEDGAADGDVVIAESQSHGRGRLGRAWISPPSLNLYLSAVLRPALPASAAPQLTLMAAVALADTVALFCDTEPSIKWPNDVLLEGKKIAGVLAESSCAAERIEFVILGIGVNLNYPAELMPEAIRDRATSLMIVRGQPVEREAFLRRLIQDLDRCYGELEEKGFGAIAQRWDARFNLKGKKIRVAMEDETLVGTAVGIDPEGALVVLDSGGASRRVFAGDVTPAE
ncbi:MAG TPA: biotin--[acetyl-CoA-carboxylase] ligase [Candidatus Eisenbacteria bacterium]|nr:biotin--[acetyl-CoA-carboxylase] ligase [Candidatus Eisenbacteria bacterium]